MRLVLQFTFLLFLTTSIYSQNEMDYYRFADTRPQASARVQGMGGSFGALGADLSSASINPAGLGRISKTYGALTLNQESVFSTATFQSQTTKKANASLKIGSAGIVLSKDISALGNGFLYRQISFGYNKIASYESKMRYKGELYNSLLDVFCTQAAGYTTDQLYYVFPFTTSLAYETYAIDYNTTTGTYVPRLTAGNMLHDRKVNQKGGSGEWYGSYSANYGNTLYLGATAFIRSVSYTSAITHTETLLDTTGVSLISFEYKENLKQTGAGAGLRIGGIYTPIPAVNIGFSAESPSRIRIKDVYTSDMTANHTDGIKKVPVGYLYKDSIRYKVLNPFKLTASFAYINSRFGSVNFDIEYVDYSMGNIKGIGNNTYAYASENKIIKDDFKTALNYRLGGEFIVSPTIMIRSGIFTNAALVNNIIGLTRSNGISVGFGYRLDNIKFDFGYSFSSGKYPYSAFIPSYTDVKYTKHTISLGIGF